MFSKVYNLLRNTPIMVQLESYNPETLEIIESIEGTSPQDVHQIVAQQKKAQEAWAQLNVSDRIRLLRKVPEEIQKNIDRIAKVLVVEIGMPTSEARGSTLKLVDRINFFLENSEPHLEPETLDILGDYVNEVHHHPVGIVACIMPWNHPFTIPFWSIIPALIAGNAVIYKPSELAILVGRELNDLMQAADLPPNIFRTVYGDGNLGRVVMQSDIDMVSFSGTIKAGKKVYAGAAAAMKKVILENGGKDAALIDQDADLEQVVDQLLIGSLRHSGQLCSSIKRVYTHSKIYRQLIERLEEGIKKIIEWYESHY